MSAAGEGSAERDLQGTVAGFASRVIADLVDLGLIFAIWFSVLLTISVARYLLVPTHTFGLIQLPNWLEVLGVYAIAVVYLDYGWATTGRSPGKQLFGLRVVDRRNPDSPPRRALLRVVLCVVFLPGILWVLVSRKNASLQDLIVRTAVIYSWPARPRV